MFLVFLSFAWKAVSAPFVHGQLFAQYCKAQIAGISQRHVSVVPSQTSPLPFQQCSSTVPGCTLSHKKALLSSKSVTFQSVRTNVRKHYKGSAWKRYNKHNIERRLSTPGGLEVLWRRVLKGRHQLAVYERILPNTVNGKILPEYHFKYQAQGFTKRKLPKPGLF